MSNDTKLYCDKCGKYFTKRGFNSHYKKCVAKFCLHCGKQLLKSDHRTKFCNSVCYSIYTSKDKDLIKNKIRICKNCEKEFTNKDGRKLFCNMSCAASFNNKKRHISITHKNKTSETLKIYFKTDVGKIHFKKLILNSHTSEIYKKRKIKREANFYKIENWDIMGKSAKKKFLNILQKGECGECGIKFWRGKPISLDFHHKDGNSYNDEFKNCILLCKNCHSQTDTYTGRNKRKIKYTDNDIIKILLNSSSIVGALNKIKYAKNQRSINKIQGIIIKNNLKHLIK